MCERICRRCGKKFMGGPRAWYCLECKSGRCKEQKLRYTQNKRAGKSIVIGKTIRKCERCGAEFIMMAARQRYCSKCRDEAVKSSDRQQGLEYYKQNRDLINLKRNKTRKMQRKKDVFCIVCGKLLTDRIGGRNTCVGKCGKIRLGYRMAKTDFKRGKRKLLPSWEEWIVAANFL